MFSDASQLENQPDIVVNENVTSEEPISVAFAEEAEEEFEVPVADWPNSNEADSDDDDFVVTIGELKPNASFQKQTPNGTVANSGGGGSGSSGGGGGGPASKLELDGTPNFKGTQIYDLDLASMEDKPWRKPGADITDYFNYGFNEDTWNQYCERQKKLRNEYGGNQEAINRTIFNSISLPNTGPQLSTMTGGRQLVNILASNDNKPKLNKVIIDLSKPPPVVEPTPSPIIRTIITGSGSVSHKLSESGNGLPSSPTTTSNSNLIALSGGGNGSLTDITAAAPIATIGTAVSGNNNALVNLTRDFSKPPPMTTSDFSMLPPLTADFAKPPPNQQLPAANSTPLPFSNTNVASAPPPLHSSVSTSGLPIPSLSVKIILDDCPPGIDEPEPPGVSTPPPGILSINTIGGFNASTLGNFNPAVPPPGVGTPSGRIGGVPSMNVPPPAIFNQHQYSGNLNSGSAGFSSMNNFPARPVPLLPPRGSGYNTLPPGTESSGSNVGSSRGRMEYKEYSSEESGDESYRRKRRRRSRSASVERLRRRKDDRERDRERDRDRDAYSSSRRRDEPEECLSRGTKRKSERSERDKERSDKKRSSGRNGEKDGEKDGADDRERKRKKHDKEKLEK